jgi:Ion channel
MGRPLVWGVCYVLLLIPFTFLYQGTGEGLVSNVTDKAQQKDLEKFNRSFERLLISKSFVPASDWSIVQVDVDGSTPTARLLLVDSLVVLTNSKTGEELKVSCQFRLRLGELLLDSSGPLLPDDVQRTLSAGIRESDMEVSNVKFDRLIQQGFATRGSGGLLRTFYFAVVVQSTLGFGDVVPISTSARTLVAVHVLLAVVLLGVFLNSLAVRASASSANCDCSGSRKST